MRQPANNMPRGHRQGSDGEPASCSSRSAAPGRDSEGDMSDGVSVNNRSSIAKRPEKYAGQDETAAHGDTGHQFRDNGKEKSCSQEREKELDSGVIGEASSPPKPDLSSPETSSGSQEHGVYSGEVSDDDEGQDEEDVLAAFVRRMGGSRIIRRILIANNGNAAVRCIRSMRHWAYEALGDSKILEFVVMATADDIDANAEFIAEADFYVEVPPGPNSNNYANLHLIVQTAETYECDAVWPGWGHASENHRLPAILKTLKRRITWIGPSPEAMLALGDKIGSSIIAQSVDVPCVPWSGMDVTVDLATVDPAKGLSPETLDLACVQSAKDVLDCCERIGYPVMIKASEGGGGKGIRRVMSAEEVPDAYRQVVNEVKGSPVFVMRMVSECRHLEVQLLADCTGRCVSLGSRDCSIQRRCQKIIEEGPVVAAPPEVVRKMEDAACRMATAVGYENAGTCEFLYDPKTHEFFFLEVNARLQVEHVVTECVGDFNLPAAQLQVSMGIKIDNIPDIKAYLNNSASQTLPHKHIIASRITAEHAEESFRPTVGLVHELTFRPSRFVWGYFSIGSKGNIHPFNDAQFGHLFAQGKDRREAIKHMVLALKDMTIRGELRTNVEALIKILEHPDFIKNDTHTTWLEQRVNFTSDSNDVSPKLLLGVLLAAVFESYTHFRESEEEFVKRVEQGQLPPSISVSYECTLVYRSTKFTLQCTYAGPGTVCVSLNNSSTTVHIRRIVSVGAGGSGSEQRDGGFLVRGGVDGKSRKVYYKEDNTGLRVSFDGVTYTFTKESDPTQVRPPVSGKLVRWLVANEQNVVKGQSYAEIEIMKMYMQLHVEETGKLMHAMSEGAVFQAGDLLATLELPPGVVVTKATPFEGTFPPSSSFSSSKEHSDSQHGTTPDDTRRNKLLKQEQQRDEHKRIQRLLNPLPTYRACRDQLYNALRGYQLRQEDEDEAVARFFECTLNPMLPVCEVKEVLAVIDSQMPEPLTTRLRRILSEAETRVVAAFGIEDKGEKEHPRCPRTQASFLDEAGDDSATAGGPDRSFPAGKQELGGGVSDGPLLLLEKEEQQTCASEGLASSHTSAGQQSPNICTGLPSSTFRHPSIGGTTTVTSKKLKSSSSPGFLLFPPFALELPVSECFAAIESQLSLQAGGAGSGSQDTSAEVALLPAAEYVGVCVTRGQLQPLFECLRKYERGLIMAAADDIASLLGKYLEVEELFENSRESAAKIISMKRTEADAAALASLQRSHQALKRKNRLVARVFEFIRTCPVWQSPLFLQRYMRSYSHFMESLPNLHDCFQRLSTLGGGSPEYAAVSLPARQLMLAKRRQPLAEQVQHLVQRISQLAGHSTPLASSVSPGSAATAAAAAAMAASAAAAAAAAASAAAVVAGAAAGGDFAVPNSNTTGAGGVVSGGPPSMNSVGACRSRLAAAAAAAAAATAAVVNLGGSPRGPLMLSTGGGGAGASGVAGGSAGQGTVGSVGCLGPQRAGYLLSGSGASPTAGGGAFLGCFDELLWDYQRCPDTALMCLFIHPHDELRKLALQLYISRHYGRHGLHEMRIHTPGEIWEGTYALHEAFESNRSESATPDSIRNAGGGAPRSPGQSSFPPLCLSVSAAAPASSCSFAQQSSPQGSFNELEDCGAFPHCSDWRGLWAGAETYVQRLSPLLAVWTHHAVLTQEFLTETLDKVKPPVPVSPPPSSASTGSTTAAEADRIPRSSEDRSGKVPLGELPQKPVVSAASSVSSCMSSSSGCGSDIPPVETLTRKPSELATSLFRRVSSNVDLASYGSSAGKCAGGIFNDLSRSNGETVAAGGLSSSRQSVVTDVDTANTLPSHTSSPLPTNASLLHCASSRGRTAASAGSGRPSSAEDFMSTLSASVLAVDECSLSGESEAWEALGRGSRSRLRHILTCFGGGENDETGRIARSQQTVAMVFDGIEALETEFVDRLREYKNLSRAMPPPPPTLDGKILMLFVLDLNGMSSTTAGKEAHCCGLIGQLLNGAAPLLQICNLHLVVVVLLSSPSHLPKSSMCVSPSCCSQQPTTDPLSLPSLPLPSGPSSVTGSLLEGGFRPTYPCAINGFLRKGLFEESHGDGSDTAVDAEIPRYFYFRNVHRLPASGINVGGKVSLSSSPPGTTSPVPTRASSPVSSRSVTGPRQQQNVLGLSSTGHVSEGVCQKGPLSNGVSHSVSSYDDPSARIVDADAKPSHNSCGHPERCQDRNREHGLQRGETAVRTTERGCSFTDESLPLLAECTSSIIPEAAVGSQAGRASEQGGTAGTGSSSACGGATAPCGGGGGGDSVSALSLSEKSRASSTLPKHFEEEDLIRNTSHAQFGLLELSRFLPNFTVRFIPTSIPDVHVYKALPKLSRPAGSGSVSRDKPVLGVAGGGSGPPTRGVAGSSGGGGGAAARAGPGQRAGGGSRYFVRVLVTVVVGLGQYNQGAGPCRGRGAGGTQDGVDGDELEGILSEQERHFVCGLNALEVSCKSGDVDAMAGNHLLLSTSILFSNGNGHEGRPSGTHYHSGGITVHRVGPAVLEAAARKLMGQYERRLAKMNVKKVEFRYLQRSICANEGPCVPIRLVVDNPTGQSLRVRKFLEVTNPTTGEQVFSALDSRGALSISGSSSTSGSVEPFLSSFRECSLHASRHRTSIKLSDDSDFDGRPVNVPHPLPSALDVRRAQAFTVSTVFIYDFLDLFEEAIRKQWRTCPKYFLPTALVDSNTGSPSRGSAAHSDANAANSFLPERVFEATELRLNRKGELEEIHREKGLNECGMVAWRVTMYTPEFPKGRRIILIGNDVTFQMGTFGVTEDLLFQRASEIARKEGIPRVYIAVNSGARMGLATEVLKLFRVEWIDESQPSRGFKYLYVREKDYQTLMQTESIVAEPVQHPVEGKVYKVTTIIGAQIGLGVENLCGSGAIAGETARAYKSTFTITFCSGRSVGIGAYLTRLGQRVIQKSVNAPLLLTGYQALNRLIGRDVYSSNDEIGGIDVMHKNGVTHLIVNDDIEGCEAILDWLAYVPEHRQGPLPIMVDPTDPVSRPVAYKPARATEDPRLMFTGCIDPQGNWLGGVFDRGSYREAMADWAKSVIIGRARLGGIPVGVVAVETRVTEAKQPADPAMPHTSEVLLMRAGQVWFPDSAYKTAQAIWDFNQEELPLFIFANWRGFSGGQRDMFNEVLKFGAYIVDALVSYNQPCFVYIPPKGELRGGSWVVVDSRLNSEYMEMYADVESRGGVMEPSGTVEIKFRDKMLVETMKRLDRIIRQLEKEDAQLASEGLPIDAPRRQEIKEKKEKRIQDLLPVYKQVAIHFADMHDTAIRMKKRDAVHDVVTWEKCRNYFYWRLRRQLILFNLRREVTIADPTLSLIQAQRLVLQWAEETGHNVEGNYQFVQWACHSIAFFAGKLAALRAAHQMKNLQEFSQDNPTAFLEILRRLDPHLYHRLELVSAVSEHSQNSTSTQRSKAALSLITKPNAAGSDTKSVEP
ncbi:acetyl-coa carboxylase acc2, partial [Cystoisospora suis]